MLKIHNFHVTINDTPILNGIDLTINPGETHAIMGPNGSGKSTLAHSLMGHPAYTITKGVVLFNNHDILSMSPDERARAGIFLAFQYPFEIEGVPLKDFLRQAYNAWYAGTDKQIGLKAWRELLEQKMALLKISPEFVERPINVGFSGGEKKRAEMLQLAVLQPRLAILDEIDSGLDIDALRIVCEGLNAIKKNNPDMAALIITHYQRILNYIKPDFVHIMQTGKIVRSGNAHLAQEIESTGYEK
jgi:Fe-S cluster assembly ATP-binding protein